MLKWRTCVADRSWGRRASEASAPPRTVSRTVPRCGRHLGPSADTHSATATITLLRTATCSSCGTSHSSSRLDDPGSNDVCAHNGEQYIFSIFASLQPSNAAGCALHTSGCRLFYLGSGQDGRESSQQRSRTPAPKSTGCSAKRGESALPQHRRPLRLQQLWQSAAQR